MVINTQTIRTNRTLPLSHKTLTTNNLIRITIKRSPVQITTVPKRQQSIPTISQSPITVQLTTTNRNSHRTVDNIRMDRKRSGLMATIIRRWQITNQRHTEQCSSHLLDPIKFPITYKVTPKTAVSPVLFLHQRLAMYSRTYKQHMTAILIFPQILKQLITNEKKEML